MEGREGRSRGLLLKDGIGRGGKGDKGRRGRGDPALRIRNRSRGSGQ